jgi:hypothetical protein
MCTLLFDGRRLRRHPFFPTITKCRHEMRFTAIEVPQLAEGLGQGGQDPSMGLDT